MITKKQRDMVRGKIEWEGFEYCFNGYSDWPEIKDKKFHQLRKAYLDAQQVFDEYIGGECGEEE